MGIRLIVSGTFDPALKNNQIGGYLKNGKYIIGEGHHRVAAAIKFGMESGNYDILTGMMNHGRWSTPTFNPISLIFPKLWQ